MILGTGNISTEGASLFRRIIPISIPAESLNAIEASRPGQLQKPFILSERHRLGMSGSASSEEYFMVSGQSNTELVVWPGGVPMSFSKGSGITRDRRLVAVFQGLRHRRIELGHFGNAESAMLSIHSGRNNWTPRRDHALSMPFSSP
jgi:hypothetical protein